MSKNLVEIEKLTKTFPLRHGLFEKRIELKAVQEVSFGIARGETLGLVGESGCGKSTLGRCLLKLIPPTGGRIVFDGQDISALTARQMKPLRRRMQIIFQDPYASLNPRMTVAELLQEPLIVHRLREGARAQRSRLNELLSLVGLPPDAAHRYPHEFSGGQRQRVGIARALAVEPDFIVCDEPVSALDISVQAQIVNLLMDLQERLGLTYLFISHDLRIVEQVSHRIAVMYLGKIIEVADYKSLYESPKHPYTRALLSAVPLADPSASRERIRLVGEPPIATSPPPGCQFHPRCFLAEERCKSQKPGLKPLLTDEKRQVACLLVE